MKAITPIEERRRRLESEIRADPRSCLAIAAATGVDLGTVTRIKMHHFGRHKKKKTPPMERLIELELSV